MLQRMIQFNYVNKAICTNSRNVNKRIRTNTVFEHTDGSGSSNYGEMPKKK